MQRISISIALVSFQNFVYKYLLITFVTYFRKGRTKVAESPNFLEDQELPKEISQVIGNLESSRFLDSLDIKIDEFTTKLCCKEFYKKHIGGVDNFMNCLLATQKSRIWEKERKLRITGKGYIFIYLNHNRSFVLLIRSRVSVLFHIYVRKR